MPTKRLILRFGPLLVCFVLLLVGIQDLKHPVIQTDQCQFVGRGRILTKLFMAEARVLYKQGSDVENNLGLVCQQQGPVLINDDAPLPVQHGQTVQLMIKQYRYWPQRYQVYLPVTNPQEAESTTSPDSKNKSSDNL